MHTKHIVAGFIFRTLVIFLFFFHSSIAFSHGDGNAKIHQLDHQIEHNPNNVKLYEKRAKLLILNENWNKALQDLKKIEKLNPENTDVYLSRAEIYYAQNKYNKSLKSINRYLTSHPDNVPGRLVRARVYTSIQQINEAETDYRFVLTNAQRTLPTWYTEFAEALHSHNKNEQAIQILEQGMATLGDLNVFALTAAEIEFNSGQVNAALTRIDTVLNKADRKDIWLALRGDFLLKANRKDEAKAAYTAALRSQANLPQHIQNKPISRELVQALETKLKTL
ncbi:tetratricopeptide repeat protein [Teredinibacter sp. KSP-S5-2]|uniref:tetratricopeptide repeat protein n=1 Tax=Teredinibacter sp. KSP-S5-2 TaxID=3034506 RepID=UPI002934E63C|nr:tetratricopeptide repeat protein [Teredinibacter sp. KSP-S5-2]WNO08436.1 tetratricopeptide repeat protein [Teredinibacter sp. KSP-S5-2]